MPRILALLFLVFLCACERVPDAYPPPEQRHPADLENPAQGSMLVNMNDADAPAHFVTDIRPALEGGSWRWTQQHPTLRILLVKTTGLKFVADFTISEITFKQTGPVTVSFYIGEKLLDKQHYETPGHKHFEKPVDPDWLQTVSDTTYSAEIDKLYISPDDGAKLGFILTRIGFERQ